MKKKLISITALLMAVPVLNGAVYEMINPELADFFSRSIEPAQAASTAEDGGTLYVSGTDNPMSSADAMRFVDKSAFVAPRVIALLEEPITTQFRVSLKAYNNAFVEGGSRGARFRITNDMVGLVTSEARTPLTITFKQDNTIQAKGDLPGSPGILFARPIELNTEYEVDIIVNVDAGSGYSYMYRGAEYSLVAESYHVFVDGELISGMPVDGLPFALTAGADYNTYKTNFGASIDQLGFVSATADTDVDWFFSDMVLLTGDDVSDEGGTDPEPTEWLGYEIGADGWVDTEEWMGLLYVLEAPWVYSYDLQNWIYIEEDGVLAGGTWSYVIRR